MRLAAGLALVLAACAPGAVGAEPEIVSARYEVDLDVYPHRIMGSIREKGVLVVTTDTDAEHRLDLRDTGPDHNVFEDIVPRVVDADGDGRTEVVVVESARRLGAQLAIYGLRDGTLTKIAGTPHIGTRFRWLAPVAITDLDGDGVTDLAFVDRPHLAKTLRIWSWAPGGLTLSASLPGVTNHTIGDEAIRGGTRSCGERPEMILADATWSRALALTWDGETVTTRDLGPLGDVTDLDGYLACP